MGNSPAPQTSRAEPVPNRRPLIFISYRWNQTKEDVWKFADYLKKRSENYFVWLDKEQMYDDKLARMQENIVKADVVVIFFNKDYQESQDCETEAKTAHSKKKKIVFVKMQEGPCELEPWFDAICVEKIYIDFYKEKQPHDKIVEHINKHLQTSNNTNSSHFVAKLGKRPVTEDYYVNRADDEKTLQNQLLRVFSESNRGILLVVGEGGIGKTTIVSQAVVSDDEFLKKCRSKKGLPLGKVVWLNVSQMSKKFNSSAFYEGLARLFDVSHGSDDAYERLNNHFQSQNRYPAFTLIVLDEVSNHDPVSATAVLGDDIYILAISRNRDVLEGYIPRGIVTIGQNEKVISDILSNHIPRERVNVFTKLCAGLPLLAKLIAAKLFDCTPREADTIKTQLLERSQTLVDEPALRDSGDEKSLKKVSQIFLLGFDEESAEFRTRFFAFLLFDQGSSVELCDLAILWQCSEGDAIIQAQTFRKRSLTRSSTSGDDEKSKQLLSIHAYLYESLLKFATNSEHKVAENHFNLKELLLLRTCQTGQESAFHQVIRLKRRAFLGIFLDVLLHKDCNSETFFTICSHLNSSGKTPFHYLLEVDLYLESNANVSISLTILCQLVDKMLEIDNARAVGFLARSEKSILSLLLNTVYDGSKWFKNALLTASTNGLLSVQGLLLDNGAGINAVDDFGNCALIKAAENGRIVAACQLLQRGAEKNFVNHEGETAFLIACRRGLIKMVKELMGANCDITSKDFKGETCLHKAVMSGETSLIEFLLTKLDDCDIIRLKNESSESALWLAEIRGIDEMVELLENAGEQLDNDEEEFFKIRNRILQKQEPEKTTCLNKALLRFLFSDSSVLQPEFEDFFRNVFNSAADNVRNIVKEGQIQREEIEKGLLLASFLGHSEIVNVLTENKVNIDFRDKDGWTPLMFASRYGHEAVVRQLIEKGADFEARDKSSRTALSIASRYGHEAVVEELLARNAFIDARNKNAWTPLMLAAGNGQCGVARQLLAKGADIDAQEKDGWTALMLASQNGHVEAVRLLLENNADTKRKTVQINETAVDIARRMGFKNIVELLK